MISCLRFSISYLIISALTCAFFGVPIFIRMYESWNFKYIGRMTIDVILLLAIVAGLLTVSFRMLHGVANLRRVSAIVLVFFLSIVGIVTSLIIGAAFGFLLSWVLKIWTPVNALVFKIQYETAVYMGSTIVVTYFPSLSMIASVAVLAALFGLPLARISMGVRFAEAWCHQAGKRWMLFWRCGIGALGLSVIWTVVSLTSHSFLIEPTLKYPTLSDFNAGISQLTFSQPTLLEWFFSLGMNLLWYSLAVGLVAYLAVQIQQRFG